MTSSSCTNCRRGSNPRISGITGMRRARANGVSMSVAEHVREPQQRDDHVRVVLGEVADERLDLEQRPLDARVAAPRVRVMSSRKKYGSCVVRAVHERRALHDDLAHRAAGRAGRREQVHRADHVDLVQRPPADRRGVDDEVRVQDRVDLGGVHDARRGSSTTSRPARTPSARAAAAARRCRAPTITSTSSSRFERCAMRLPQNVPSPVTRTRIRRLSRTRRCAGCAACRRAPPGSCSRMCSASSMTRLARVALLVGRHVEVHRRRARGA